MNFQPKALDPDRKALRNFLSLSVFAWAGFAWSLGWLIYWRESTLIPALGMERVLNASFWGPGRATSVACVALLLSAALRYCFRAPRALASVPFPVALAMVCCAGYYMFDRVAIASSRSGELMTGRMTLYWCDTLMLCAVFLLAGLVCLPGIHLARKRLREQPEPPPGTNISELRTPNSEL